MERKRTDDSSPGPLLLSHQKKNNWEGGEKSEQELGEGRDEWWIQIEINSSAESIHKYFVGFFPSPEMDNKMKPNFKQLN